MYPKIDRHSTDFSHIMFTDVMNFVKFEAEAIVSILCNFQGFFKSYNNVMIPGGTQKIVGKNICHW